MTELRQFHAAAMVNLYFESLELPGNSCNVLRVPSRDTNADNFPAFAQLGRNARNVFVEH